MTGKTWRRWLNGALLGIVCGVAAFAVAIVSGYTLAQMQMGDRLDAREPTPTVRQLQQLMERMTAQPPAPATTPGVPDWGVGTSNPTPEATAAASGTPASGTPATSSTPAPLRGGGNATPVVFNDDDVTPQATPSLGLSVIPTATPFVPPTIVPIQSMATPRP